MKTLRTSVLMLLATLGLSRTALFAELVAKASTPIAKVGNTVLTEDDLRKDMGMSYYEAENSLYQARKSWVDQKVKSLVFAGAAKDAGVTPQAWQAREIEGKIAAPTTMEIDQWYPKFMVTGSSVTPTPEQVLKTKEQAKQYLLGQKRSQRENEVYQQLVSKTPVELYFTKPEAPHIDVTYTKENAMKGPANAPVTVVEFTDFQCPWCGRSQPSIQAVEKAYGDKVKIVLRNFPLTQIHPFAMPAARFAACSQEQGKFWPTNDKLFSNQTALTETDLKRYAKEIGLNESKLDKCLKSDRPDKVIATDMADAQRFGVRGTPTFFVNGMQTGFPQLQDTVKAELEKTEKK